MNVLIEIAFCRVFVLFLFRFAFGDWLAFYLDVVYVAPLPPSLL